MTNFVTPSLLPPLNIDLLFKNNRVRKHTAKLNRFFPIFPFDSPENVKGIKREHWEEMGQRSSPSPVLCGCHKCMVP